MDNYEFEVLVAKHSLCPNDKLYNSNALAGETGEVANVVKKIQMVNLHPEWIGTVDGKLKPASEWEENLIDELSDVLFYLTRLALDNGVSLENLMSLQQGKLIKQSQKYQRTFLK